MYKTTKPAGVCYTNSKGMPRHVVDKFRNNKGIVQVTYYKRSSYEPVRTCSEKAFLLWVNSK